MNDVNRMVWSLILFVFGFAFGKEAYYMLKEYFVCEGMFCGFTKLVAGVALGLLAFLFFGQGWVFLTGRVIENGDEGGGYEDDDEHEIYM